MGGISGGDDGGQALALIAHRLSGGAEIEQHRLPTFTHKDIGRLDIAMQKPRLVDFREPAEQGVEHGANLRLLHRPFAFEDLVKAFAGFVVHHHVGGVIGLEETQDLDDVGMAKCNEGLGFDAEPRKAPFEVALVIGTHRKDSDRITPPHGDAGGQIFLDRDQPVEAGLARFVGNTETPGAEDGLDPVAFDLITPRQRVELVLGHATPDHIRPVTVLLAELGRLHSNRHA